MPRNTCRSWLSKKQRTMATFSSEAKYRETFVATIESVWFICRVADSGVRQQSTTTIFTNSQRPLELQRAHIPCSWTLGCSIIMLARDSSLEISLEQMCQQKKLANTLTNALPRQKFEAFL